MLRQGAISPARRCTGAVESLLFCVSKRGGGWRPCLNLRPLNEHVVAPKFTLRGIGELRQTLQAGDHMVSLDLRNAYWHVPLRPADRKLFQFRFDGVLYEFKVLPFGVSVAPYVFHRLLQPVVAWLRRAGVRLCIYLDDVLVLGRDYATCLRHGQLVADLLHDLGFQLHQDKSELRPSTRRTFLGFEVDSKTMTLHLPHDKVRRISRECRRLANLAAFRNESPSVRTLARLLGSVTAASSAVTVHRFRSGALERARATALRAHGAWDGPCPLPPEAVKELRWWGANLHRVHGRPVRLPSPDVVVQTDASALGWGAVVIDSAIPSLRGATLHGRLPRELRDAVSNETELYGVGAALHALARLAPLARRHVRVQTDSTAALYYVNKGAGRSQPLSRLALPIWRKALRSQMLVSAEHLPGLNNSVADALSRRAPSADDWELRPRTFRDLCRRFRTPTVDAFAEPANAKLRRFAARYPLPGALPLHGLLLDYRRELAYAFPPPRLVPLLLSRLLEQRATALLVLPVCPQAPWWPWVVTHMPDRILLRDAVRPYFSRAKTFRQPLLTAGLFSA